MNITGVVETAIAVTDVAASAAFYERVLGFGIQVQDDRFAALTVAPTQVFLIFKRGATSEPMPFAGGTIPGHDGSGRMHFAFGIPAADFNVWLGRLRTLEIEVESTVEWPRGGKSIYFRDPDQHAVELVTPGVWENY